MKDIKKFTNSPDSIFTAQTTLMIFLIIMFVINVPTSIGQINNFVQFEHLKQPQISTKKDQKMLVVKSKGDPNIIGGKAFLSHVHDGLNHSIRQSLNGSVCMHYQSQIVWFNFHPMSHKKVLRLHWLSGSTVK
jgi:hypothetical protein